MNFTALKKYAWIIPLLAALAGNVTVLGNGFIWDDPLIVNDLLPNLSGLTDAFFKQGLMHTGGSYYRPLVYANYLLARLLAGSSPVGFHLTVLAYHAATTLLVYALAKRLLKEEPGAVGAALLSSTLFAVHPAHAEVTAWMTGCNDGLIALFFLASLLLAERYLERGGGALLAWCALATAGALFTKETAVAILPLLLWWRCCLAPRRGHDPEREKKRFTRRATARWRWILASTCGVVIIYALFRWSYLEGSGVLDLKYPAVESVRLLALGLWFYLKAFFVPLKLSFYIPSTPPNEHPILTGLFLAALPALAFVDLRRGRGMIALCLGAFALTLLPSLAVAISAYSETPLALRYLYLPSVWLCILVAFLVWRGVALIPGRAKLAAISITTAAGLATIGALAVINFRMNGACRNEVAFWNAVIRTASGYGLPHLSLGHAYQRSGRAEEAIEQFRIALASEYDDEGKAYAFNNLGAIFLQRGDRQAARQFFLDAIALRSDYFNPRFNLAYIDAEDAERLPEGAEKSDKLQVALALVTEAIAIYPHAAKAYELQGRIYRMLGDEAAAAAAFERARRIQSSSP